MMKKMVAVLLLAVLVVSLLAGCGAGSPQSAASGTPGAEAPPANTPAASTAAGAARDYAWFAGKEMAVITGVLTVNTSEKIGAIPVEYKDSASAAEEVRQGRVAGYMHALTAVQVMAAQMPEFEVFPIPKDIFAAQIAAFSSDQAVVDRFNTFLAQVEADGTLADMQERWFSDKLDLDAPIPDIPNSGENGTFSVAICSDAIPYVYAVADGTYSGYSVELALRFGAHEGKTIEFTDMAFDGLVPYVNTAKAELGIANVAITEERSKSVLFTDPIFDEGHGILALKEAPPPDASTAAPAPPRFESFVGQTLGIPTGYVLDALIEEDLAGTVAHYSETSAGLEDVRQGRIAGFMTDLSIARVIENQPENSDLVAVAVPEELFSGPLGAISTDAGMMERFDAFLTEIETDGTLKQMQLHWIEENPGADPPMPEIPIADTDEVLPIAIGSGSLPFCYIGTGGEVKGFCAELMLRFAARENLRPEFTTMEFSALIPYITAGKAAIGIDAITITEERMKSVLFSQPFYYDHIGILALKSGGSSVAAGVSSYSYTDLAGKKIGGVTGGAWEDAVNQLGAEPAFYTQDSAGIEDVRAGRIFGQVFDLTAARVMVATSDDLAYIEIPRSIFSAPMGGISMDGAVIDRFNAFLAAAQANGTIEDMQRRWLKNIPDLDAPMPDIPNEGTAGTITVATCSTMLPFSYVGGDNELKGYSIELALRFGAHENMKIEFTDMDFDALIPYIVSEKADLSLSAMSITEERKQSVLFTDSVYDDQWGVVVLKETPAEAPGGGGFFEWLKTGVERNLLTDGRWKMIVNGLLVTMIIALCAQFFGTVLGAFICFLLTRKNRLVRGLGNLYCGLIRGLPVVVLLMITYYIIFGNSTISNVIIAVAAFTIVTGASVAETLKGAIATVDPVEIEAARSLGFSAFRAFRTVTMPQAIRRALPGYTGGFVELVKATAIVGYVAIQDLMRAADIIRSRTYDAYFPLLFVGVIYLIITTICIQLFKLIVKKINGGEAG